MVACPQPSMLNYCMEQDFPCMTIVTWTLALTNQVFPCCPIMTNDALRNFKFVIVYHKPAFSMELHAQKLRPELVQVLCD